jgi:hypothetical protein
VKPEKVFIGSLASLIVAEAARAARIEIGFAEYSRVGVPVTVATLLIGGLVLVVVPVRRRRYETPRWRSDATRSSTRSTSRPSRTICRSPAWPHRSTPSRSITNVER